MDTTQLIVLVVLVVLVVAIVAAAFVLADRRRSERLRARFGPEYDRTVSERDDRRKAEAELDARRQRVDRLKIRPLEPRETAQFSERWRGVQARFVDDPPGAVLDADALVEDAMAARGYPVADFEQQADDISVNHPGVVADYRAAHGAAEKQQRDGATTEELRKAMVHFRSLFEELIGSSDETVRAADRSSAPVADTPVADGKTPPEQRRQTVDSAPGTRS